MNDKIEITRVMDMLNHIENNEKAFSFMEYCTYLRESFGLKLKDTDEHNESVRVSANPSGRSDDISCHVSFEDFNIAFWNNGKSMALRLTFINSTLKYISDIMEFTDSWKWVKEEVE